ncbi:MULTISPECIES: hypothetical protein [Bacillus cereus group]|uniref:hypothetical protein n=1 Tax=Bacillus TaxID=1386 RepID=UPI0035585DB6
MVEINQYMIYAETKEKQHFLFKSNIMGVIPNEKIDLKKVKEFVKNHLSKKTRAGISVICIILRKKKSTREA